MVHKHSPATFCIHKCTLNVSQVNPAVYFWESSITLPQKQKKYCTLFFFLGEAI